MDPAFYCSCFRPLGAQKRRHERMKPEVHSTATSTLAYEEKDAQVLRIAASDVAAVAGYNEWVDVRELFLGRLLYQVRKSGEKGNASKHESSQLRPVMWLHGLWMYETDDGYNRVHTFVRQQKNVYTMIVR